jgi:hypothetical protein
VGFFFFLRFCFTLGGGHTRAGTHRFFRAGFCSSGNIVSMTSEDVLQELERDPFVPLRLHLASGKTMDIEYPQTAWLRQNTLLVVHPVRPRSQQIGNYDVIALRLIERIERIDAGKAKRRRKA